MNIAENIRVTAEIAGGWTKERLNERVDELLDLVGLPPAEFRKRFPRQLSGGQQQRVALARALVFEPSLVLMDEPLGALDKKLREHMQIELKQLHDMLDLTVVYVTHDQSEALTMSDRVAVFESGAVAQIGTPDALYKEPANAFVANFIGENNTLEGMVERIAGGECLVVLRSGDRITATAVGELRQGERATVTIRPERIALAAVAGDGETTIVATAEGRIYLGDHQRLLARLANGAVLTVKLGPDAPLVMGEGLTLAWSTADARAFAMDSDSSSKPGRTS